MDWISAIEKKANRSSKLKKQILIIQDTETRIKDIIVRYSLVGGNLDMEQEINQAIVKNASMIENKEERERFISKMKENAMSWTAVMRQSLPVSYSKKRTKELVIKAQDSQGLSHKGNMHVDRSNYQQRVSDMIRKLAAHETANLYYPFATNKRGQENNYLSFRAVAERQIRDEIHHEINDSIARENNLVWISSHADCSERCEKWQGRLYSTNGKTGEVEGHKYVPLEIAKNSNHVTTKAGVTYNNSILVGFNCRHFLIPFKPGTVPVFKYDTELVKKEREINKRQRELERAVLAVKWQHRAYTYYSRVSKGAIKAEFETKKKIAFDEYRTLEAEYNEFCASNHRAYIPWRCSLTIPEAFYPDELDKADEKKYNGYVNGKHFRRINTIVYQDITDDTYFHKNPELALVTDKDKGVFGYSVTKEVQKFNSRVRTTNEEQLSGEDPERVKAADILAERGRNGPNLIADRYTDENNLKYLSGPIKEGEGYSTYAKRISEEMKVRDVTWPDKGYCCTSVVRGSNKFQTSEVHLVLLVDGKLPKFYTDNIEESELVLKRRLNYRLHNISVEQENGKDKLVMVVEAYE